MLDLALIASGSFQVSQNPDLRSIEPAVPIAAASQIDSHPVHPRSTIALPSVNPEVEPFNPEFSATVPFDSPPFSSSIPSADSGSEPVSMERAIAAESQSHPAINLIAQHSPTPSPIAADSLPGELEVDEVSFAGMDQVTSVSELSDVQPGDWAFQALQSLVERYGCIEGYPNATFRGDRTLSRYEFAAGLNACLNQMESLIASRTDNSVQQADLAIVRTLQEQFAAELTALSGRIESLETRTAALEENSFSTTTRLFGQAIFGLQGSNEIGVDLFPQDGIQEREGRTEGTLGYNLQLSFATSFRGDDLLLTGLQTGNIAPSSSFLSTNMGRLSYESGLENDLVVSDLSYRFPLGDRVGVIVGAAGVNPTNTFRGINPLEGSGDGSLSLLGQRNPILALGNGTGGVGFDWQIAPRISLQGIYSAELPAFASDDDIGGLLGGRYTAGAQLTLAPTNTVALGIHYLYSRSPDGILGTGIGDSQVISPLVADPVEFKTHAVGGTIAWRVNPRWTLGGWGGWTISNPTDLSGSVETTNWMVFSTFPDLLGRGNLGALLVGQPPKITSSTLPDGLNFPRFGSDGSQGGQPDSALHIEMLYRLAVTSNISLTPGVMVVLNPNHNADNDTLVIGAVRATFRF